MSLKWSQKHVLVPVDQYKTNYQPQDTGGTRDVKINNDKNHITSEVALNKSTIEHKQPEHKQLEHKHLELASSSETSTDRADDTQLTTNSVSKPPDRALKSSANAHIKHDDSSDTDVSDLELAINKELNEKQTVLATKLVHALPIIWNEDGEIETSNGTTLKDSNIADFIIYTQKVEARNQSYCTIFILF
jgi:hypothetical protein